MRSFLAALRFLTILPLPGAHNLDDEDWGRATAWYPAVGLLLGLILAGLDWCFRWLWPIPVASALLLAAWVALTGALHIDGFVDCCDALLAPVSRERRLEILRDVHAGAFGLVGVVLLLLLKYAALVTLPGTARLPALFLVPTLARWAMTGAVLLYPYARAGQGLGRRAKTGAGSWQFVNATASAVLAAVLAAWLGLGWVVWLLWALVFLCAALQAQWMRSRLGGLTGDTYGAICEAAETVSLLALALLAGRQILL